ncbi:MAG TPA: hypothetical protein VGS19_17770 [Streptosporangiaceae bacterium]|nr:hypothetical protein [Streptosporangiaceae bacterium]
MNVKLVLVAAVASAATSVLSGTAAGHAAVAPARAPVIPLSVSFVSPSQGWMLGVARCTPTAGCRTLLMRKTANGGRTWVRAPAPPAQLSVYGSVVFTNPAIGRPGGVDTVLFANASDGWVYGPGLLATHDGGTTWHRIATHGLLVTRMTAGGGHILAVFQKAHCGTTAVCPSHLFTARVGSDSFRQLPGTAGAAGGTTSSIAISGGQAYVGALHPTRAGLPHAALLTGSVNGSAPWHALNLPGRPGNCGMFGMFLAAAGPQLALGCAGQPGGAPPGPRQPKWIYLSTTGRRSWQQVTRPPAIPGYMTDLSATAPGILAESGARANVHLSRDGGHTWHTSPSLARPYRATGGAGLAATMVNSHFGFATIDDPYLPRIYFTHDGGHTWTWTTINQPNPNPGASPEARTPTICRQHPHLGVRIVAELISEYCRAA